MSLENLKIPIFIFPFLPYGILWAKMIKKESWNIFFGKSCVCQVVCLLLLFILALQVFINEESQNGVFQNTLLN